MLTHGSLFSGIGGFDLAAEWAGWQNLWHCEIDKFCSQVLQKNFPNTPNYGDITKADWATAPRVDVISGGFPCQPFSTAGKRRGKEDDRFLWPAMLEVIRTIRPTWVVGENVAGIVSMVLDDVCADLENQGYEVQSVIIPASAIGASHRRDRVWIVAYAKGSRRERHLQLWRRTYEAKQTTVGDTHATNTHGERELQQKGPEQDQWERPIHGRSIFTNPIGEGLQGREQSGAPIETEGPSRPTTQLNGHEWPEVAARICRVDDGLSRKLDRGKRLKALGNAIVPQVAYQIFQAINETYTDEKD